MTPDQIKSFIEANYADIVCKRLKYGWSFWYREIASRPDYSARIARARQSPGHTTTDFKLAVTSRLAGKEAERSISSEEQLRHLFDQELSLWKRTFE